MALILLSAKKTKIEKSYVYFECDKNLVYFEFIFLLRQCDAIHCHLKITVKNLLSLSNKPVYKLLSKTLVTLFTWNISL